MYYTPALNDLFQYHRFSYRALQARLKVIRSHFSDAVTVKLNSKAAVLDEYFCQLCFAWSVLKARYDGHNEYINAKYGQPTANAVVDVFNQAIAKGFTPAEATEMQRVMSNNPSPRARKAIEVRLA